MSLPQFLFTAGCTLAGTAAVFSTIIGPAKETEKTLFTMKMVMYIGIICMIAGIGIKTLFP